MSPMTLYRDVGQAEEDGRAVARVHVLVKGPAGHRQDVFLLPVQPLAVDYRVT